MQLGDKDLFPWLETARQPTDVEHYLAATIIADRLCGAATDPIVRNAQEQRQLEVIRQWLLKRGYIETKANERANLIKWNRVHFLFD